VIAVDMRGRMGNQMFQVAFALAAATRLRTRFAILGPCELAEHFERPPLGRPLERHAARLAFYARHGRAPRLFVEGAVDPTEFLTTLRNGRRYSGFFQSAAYFAGCENNVRDMFRVRSDHVATFERTYGELGRYVCVHVRRGDYLSAGWSLPASYFRAAVTAVPECADLPTIVVSDDLPGAQAEYDWPEGTRFVSNAPAVDLQLLSHASVVIASNSSFSWWGAWLNVVPDAQVAAPACWLGVESGTEDPPGVIPPGWIRVGLGDRRASTQVLEGH
jgi:hypothetical protein